MKSFMVLILLLLHMPTIAAEKKVEEILDHLDKLYRSKSSYSEVDMKVITPHWQRTLELKVWTMGMKETFIRILSPKKDAGIATLRKDNDMWNFFPKINKVIKVPPSMRMGSWMGSDFTNDDLVKETTFIDDYHGKFIEGNEKDFYHIELTPRKGTVSVWGKIIKRVRKSDLMPVDDIYFNERGEKARTILFKDIKTIGGKTFPSILELIPFTKKGNKTMIIYKEIKFDIDVGKNIFTRRNLQKRK